MPTQKPLTAKMPPMTRGNQWEKNVYFGILDYFKKHSGGYVHHLVQPVYHGRVSAPQVIDILVDNFESKFFGIECKASGIESTHVTSWFHGVDSEQFAKETEFLRRSGRIGVIAYTMPEAGCGSRSRYGSYLIPWHTYPMLLHRKITTDVLDGFVQDEFVHKIPTTNGTVVIDDSYYTVFRELARMDRRAYDALK